jgi:voltage-gated potassium channel
MLALSLYAIAVLAAEAVIRLDPEVKAVFDYADYAVCGIFFADFLISLWWAPNRLR